jgi:CCR4-NOT transcription complex subunit 1
MLLLTDYGKFGSKYAFNFADEVPFNHVQLLNMSLAAFPNAHIDDPQSCTSIYEIPDSKEFGIIAHSSLEE